MNNKIVKLLLVFKIIIAAETAKAEVSGPSLSY